MDDVQRLLAAFESKSLLRPAGEEASTVDLAAAIATVCGASDVEMRPPARDIARRIAADHIVFVLVDGLGMNLIERQPEDAFLRSHTSSALRAVFPSTTATALTSLATGLWPAQHAIPGWWTYLPEYELTSTVLPFVERFTERPLAELGVDQASVYLAPSLAASFVRDVSSFLPEQIATSAYTSYVTGAGRVAAYEELSSATDAIIARVRRASERTYTYLYFPFIDALQHALGPDAPEVDAAVRVLNRQLARLARGIAERGRLVVSADHGLVAVEDAGKHLVQGEIKELLLVPPSGEPRVPYFHVKPGLAADFAERFRERCGQNFALLSVDEVNRLGLFGPVAMSTKTRERVGDFVGIALGRDVLLSNEMEFRGFHGALTPEEMRIPLIIA